MPSSSSPIGYYRRGKTDFLCTIYSEDSNAHGKFVKAVVDPVKLDKMHYKGDPIQQSEKYAISRNTGSRHKL